MSQEVFNLLVAVTALVVSLVSGYYTFRAFALARQSSSAAGLQFMISGQMEEVELPAAPGERATARRSYYRCGIASRGPGVRYMACGAVWGTVDAQVLTPQLPVWSATDAPITFELRHDDRPWEGVYVGVVWEIPRLLRNGFSWRGLRMPVAAPGQQSPFGPQQWSPLRKQWVPMKSRSRAPHPQFIASSTAVGLSLMEQFSLPLTSGNPG